MRSIFRFYIFESLRNYKSDCGECGNMNGLMIDEDGGGDIPASFYKWPPPNKNLEQQYGEEHLKKCPVCGTYYAYSITQPGGSSDAMSTIGRERLYRIGYLEAYLILRESEEEIVKLLHHDPKYYRPIYDQHQKGLDECDLLRKNPLVISEAVTFFKADISKNIQYYQKETIEMEDEVARIVSGCLFSMVEKLPPEDLCEVLDIISSSRKEISEQLASGFSIGAYHLSKQPEKVLKLIEHIKTLPEGNFRIIDIDDQLKDFFRPPRAVTKFYSGSIGNISDDELKQYLQKLSGLEITSYIEGGYTEAIIDFRFENFKFSANNAYLDWQFFVTGDCPSKTLDKITAHLRAR